VDLAPLVAALGYTIDAQGIDDGFITLRRKPSAAPRVRRIGTASATFADNPQSGRNGRPHRVIDTWAIQPAGDLFNAQSSARKARLHGGHASPER
jgi:hypothetical protein